MRFITLKKEQNNYNKCPILLLPQFLHLFFASYSVVFVQRGRKNISCPRAQGIQVTPLFLGSLAPMSQSTKFYATPVR